MSRKVTKKVLEAFLKEHKITPFEVLDALREYFKGYEKWAATKNPPDLKMAQSFKVVWEAADDILMGK